MDILTEMTEDSKATNSYALAINIFAIGTGFKVLEDFRIIFKID